MTEIKAISKFVRVSPKKLRLLTEALEGISPDEALIKLKFLKKSGGKDLAKTIKSALANAENNLKINKENLKIKKILIEGGPAFKRFRPVARGAAHQYKRRTSHIQVILEEVTGGTENKS